MGGSFSSRQGGCPPSRVTRGSAARNCNSNRKVVSVVKLVMHPGFAGTKPPHIFRRDARACFSRPCACCADLHAVRGRGLQQHFTRCTLVFRRHPERFPTKHLRRVRHCAQLTTSHAGTFPAQTQRCHHAPPSFARTAAVVRLIGRSASRPPRGVPRSHASQCTVCRRPKSCL